MIRICVTRRADGLELTAVGHAGYAERGRDIVCAGVSALLFGFLRHLETHLPPAEADGAGDARPCHDLGDSGDRRDIGGRASPPSVESEVGEGSLWIRTHGMAGMDTAAWEVTRAGLSLIAEAHPSCVILSEGRAGPSFAHISMKGRKHHGHRNPVGGHPDG